MIVAAVLWLAVCLCGSGLIGGAEISCDGKYKRECESFNKDFPTISMLMHDRKARAVMRGCLFPGVLLNGASDVGLAAALAAGRRPNSTAPSRCTSSVTARAAGSFDGGCPRLRRGREADDASNSAGKPRASSQARRASEITRRGLRVQRVGRRLRDRVARRHFSRPGHESERDDPHHRVRVVGLLEDRLGAVDPARALGRVTRSVHPVALPFRRRGRARRAQRPHRPSGLLGPELRSPPR